MPTKGTHPEPTTTTSRSSRRTTTNSSISTCRSATTPHRRAACGPQSATGKMQVRRWPADPCVIQHGPTLLLLLLLLLRIIMLKLVILLMKRSTSTDSVRKMVVRRKGCEKSGIRRELMRWVELEVSRVPVGRYPSVPGVWHTHLKSRGGICSGRKR